MAKRRTQDFDVSAFFKNEALNVLVVQRNSGRIMASLAIPGPAASAFAEVVAAALNEAEQPTVGIATDNVEKAEKNNEKKNKTGTEKKSR